MARAYRSTAVQQRRTPQSAQDLLITQGNDGAGTLLQPTTVGQKRKPSRETNASDQPVQKQQRLSSTAAEDTHKDTASDSVDSNNPVDYWCKYQRWPRAYFESDANMSSQLSRKTSISTFRRKSSTTSINSSVITPAGRENKGSVYRDIRCVYLLEAGKSYLRKDEIGVTPESKTLCKELLEAGQPVPQDSLFNDDIFEETCEYLRNRSEAMIIRDIGLLIVPAAAHFARRSAKNLRILVETVNERWSESITLPNIPRPQPDYAVGFGPSSFSDEHLKRLKPFIGGLSDESAFAAKWYMYFPFLTCEVKCGAEGLDIADRQNAHSATLAVRAIVELFRLVKREKELDHEILAFSISHDHSSVRIYGHYPVIDEKDTKYYRYLIAAFSFTRPGGKEKWTAYKFTKNVYDNWMPDHFKRICSAIEDLPSDVNFDVSQESELQFSSQTGLSEELEGHHLSQSEGLASVAGQDDGSSIANAEITTSDTSVAQNFNKQRRER